MAMTRKQGFGSVGVTRARAWVLLLGICSGCFGPDGGPCANGDACPSEEHEGAVFEQEPNQDRFIAGSAGGGGGDFGPIIGLFDAGVEESKPPPSHCDDDAGDCSTAGDGESVASVSRVRALQLSRDDVYVLEWGSDDALGNHQGDGRIVRVPRTGIGDPTVVASDIVKPMDMLLDPESVLWTERHGDDLQIWAADRDDGGNRRMLAEGLNLTWAQDATHVYYMTEEHGSHGDPVKLFRVEKASGSIEELSDADFDSAFPLVVGDEVYVFGDLGFHAVPRNGGDAVRIADGPMTDIAFAIEGGDLFYGTLSGAVRRLHVEGASDLVLAQYDEDLSPLRVVPHRGHLYVSHPTAGGERVIDHTFHNPSPLGTVIGPTRLVTIAGSASVVSTYDLVFAVDETDLYWAEGDSLMHQFLARAIEGVSPLVGEQAAPCHPDLSCANDTLECVGGVCR